LSANAVPGEQHPAAPEAPSAVVHDAFNVVPDTVVDECTSNRYFTCDPSGSETFPVNCGVESEVYNIEPVEPNAVNATAGGEATVGAYGVYGARLYVTVNFGAYDPFVEENRFQPYESVSLARTEVQNWSLVLVSAAQVLTRLVTGISIHPAAHEEENPFAADTDPALAPNAGWLPHRVAVVASPEAYTVRVRAEHEYECVLYSDIFAETMSYPLKLAFPNRTSDRALVTPPS
jgi:hypothetical protein